MEVAAIIISLFALLFSGLSYWSSDRYSKINLTHTIQDLVLQKAKDCNAIYEKDIEEGFRNYTAASIGRYYSTISETIISLQLLDNLLKEYSLNKKREFFLTQFWTQLSTDIRYYFKTVNFEEYRDTIK